MFRRALVFTVTVCSAYGAGFTLILWRTAAAEAKYDASGPQGSPIPAHLRALSFLDWLVPDSYFPHAFHRYPSWALTDPGFYAPVLLVVLASAVLGVLAAVRTPVAIACPHLPGLPSGDRGTRRAWRSILLHQRGGWAVWIAAATVGGLSAALFGDALAMAVGYARQEGAWGRGAPASVVYLKPALGSLALPDAIYVIAWTTLTPFVLTILAARKRFIARERRARARCLRCGYPTPAPQPERGEAPSPCPECGARQEPKGADRRAGACVAFVLAGVLLLALIAFGLVPLATA